MRLSVLAAVLLCGCAPYRDFTLPPPVAGTPIRTWRWVPDPVPVIGRGAPGEWDSADVLNPSVVRFQGSFLNFYSGFEGKTWRTGLATSPDGLNWTKQGRILSPEGDEGDYIAANGTALVFSDRCFYWYQTGPKEMPHLAVAISSDCRKFRKTPPPVLGTGPYMSWDERGVGDPYVVEAGGRLYMFYLGQDRARRQRIGVARSDDGFRWVKLRANPILELGDPGAFDENGLGEPAVWHSGGAYWMIYTGRDRQENRRLGLAQSTDGVRWEKLSEVFTGAEPWNWKVICDPSLMPGPGDEQRVWFGGGDKASPDENLSGQIGVARLVPVR